MLDGRRHMLRGAVRPPVHKARAVLKDQNECAVTSDLGKALRYPPSVDRLRP